jgi:hypothetical protein
MADLKIEEIKEDPEECKRVTTYLQWKFEKKFDKPSNPKAVPTKEHFFAFYNFYEECEKDSDNILEKKICLNQMRNILNITKFVHKVLDFQEEYNMWLQNKVFPSWQ